MEPHRLVNWGRRWYLVAWDVDRADWRTFRVDRVTPRTPTGPKFTPRELPGGDVAEYVACRASSAGWRHTARILVHAPADAVTERINPAVGLVEAVYEDHCVLITGAGSLDTIVLYVGLLDMDFEVTGRPDLAE